MDLWYNDFSTIEDVQMIDLTSERVVGGLRRTDVGLATRAAYFRDENLTIILFSRSNVPVDCTSGRAHNILGSFCRSQPQA